MYMSHSRKAQELERLHQVSEEGVQRKTSGVERREHELSDQCGKGKADDASVGRLVEVGSLKGSE